LFLQSLFCRECATFHTVVNVEDILKRPALSERSIALDQRLKVRIESGLVPVLFIHLLPQMRVFFLHSAKLHQEPSLFAILNLQNTTWSRINVFAEVILSASGRREDLVAVKAAPWQLPVFLCGFVLMPHLLLLNPFAESTLAPHGALSVATCSTARLSTLRESCVPKR
jgi:hypothetical protein